jgi:hypothetical protein
VAAGETASFLDDMYILVTPNTLNQYLFASSYYNTSSIAFLTLQTRTCLDAPLPVILVVLVTGVHAQ